MTNSQNQRKVSHEIIRRVWLGWIARYKVKIFGAFSLMAFVAASASAYPLLTKYIFNALADGEAIKVIWLAPPVIIFFSVLKGLALFGQTVMINSLALRVTTDLQQDMAKTLIQADLFTITREPSGVFVSRIMNDLNLVREALVRLANNLVRDSLTVLVLIMVMFWLDWLMALLVVGVYPLAIRPIIRIGMRQRKVSGNLQEHMETVTSILAEMVYGARMIRTFQREKAETNRANTAFNGLYGRLVSLFTGRAKIDPILEVVGGFAVGGVISFASWRILNGDMQVGDVVAFVTTLILLVQPVRAIGTLNAILQEALAAGERIFKLLDAPRLIVDRPDAIELRVKKGKIRFDKVCFSYQKANNDIGDEKDLVGTLKDVSFTVKSGQSVALVGPSGSGKTTVMNLLPRFFDPDSGAIFIDEKSIAKVKIESLRESIALVSQETILFDDTIAANIGFGRAGATLEEIKAAAVVAAAEEFILEFPGGYETRVGSMGNQLSGGQRQRIAIARAILKNAPILLLDEATAALDADSELKIQVALKRLQAGRTTIIVAHRLATIRDADMILVMDNGKIVEVGTHSSLTKKGGVYARLCQLQFFGNG